MDKVVMVKWQSDLVYTKEIILPVCDISYHTNKKKSTERVGDWSFGELCIVHIFPICISIKAKEMEVAEELE